MLKTKKGINVLFVYPNTYSEGCLQIGIANLSAVLKRASHKTRLFDTTFFEKGTPSVKEIGEKTLEFKKVNLEEKGIYLDKKDMIEEFKKTIEEFNPDLIAVSATSTIYPLGLKLLRSIEHIVPVVVGGSHATVVPEEVITEDCVDMVCIGEGEETMVELCNKIREQEDIIGIKGLWIKKDGQIYKNELRNLIQDFDNLPYPDWSIFDERHLFKPFVGNIYKLGHFEMSRGCPFSCTYCINKHVQTINKGKGKYHRSKSLMRMIDEIKYYKAKYGLEMLKLWDETFLIMPQNQLESFLKMYKKEINLPFLIQTRPDTINEQNAQMLKEAGCITISIGIESGDDEIRNKILNRKMSRETIIKAFHILRKVGIRTTSFNMIGLPYETRKQIFNTIKINKESNPDTCNVMLFYPFKGTELGRICEKEGFVPKNTEAVNIHADSILNMPQISREELIGIKKVFMMYVKAPIFLYPLVRICEKDNFISNPLFWFFSKYYYIKLYGFK